MTPALMLSITSIIISVEALLLSFLMMRIQRRYYDTVQAQKLMDRMYDLDRLHIQTPDLQVCLYELAGRTDPYFTLDTPHDAMYVRVKTLVYLYLNFFDDIVSNMLTSKSVQERFEFEDWKKFIIERMGHPLFRELYQKEASIYGKAFRQFCDENWKAILDVKNFERF